MEWREGGSKNTSAVSFKMCWARAPGGRRRRPINKGRTFSPGWWLQPGLKVYFYSRLVAPTGSKGLPPGRGCARGWKVTFSPGWSHQPGLKVSPLYPGRLLPPRARAQHILKLTVVVFLLPPSLHCSSIHSSILPSISSISPSILQL